MINRLLVANRGEVARRIFATCRRAGIGCVAVASDPDLAAPHAREADTAVRLPGASAAQTYLNGPAIVAAALAAGADAVHPGYGFLSEDARFARQVQAAGLTWVGPPAEVIEALSSKITSKRLAADVGVPVLPLLDPASVTTFPVLIKASGGGGGRGMRVVTAAAGLRSAIDSARREAQAAFGDPAVFCEPLLTGARHVEVQILADSHGTIWTLTERDCSVQRRYQKVIEESPSPAVGPRLRADLLAAAAAVTRAARYAGAGTAEFLLAADGRYYFLEFNTRLQVEHPVTECVHGIDVVAAQLDIAAGLPLRADPPAPAGHAIEARLYAEEPAEGYRPATGTMHQLSVPGADTSFTVPGRAPAAGWLRLDAGVEPGSEISAHYDPMIAKLIAWAPDRMAAARSLAGALDRATIHGPATNRALLASVLRHPRFLAGQADTSLLEHYDLAALAPRPAAIALSAAAAALADAAAARAGARVAATLPLGWRNVVSQPQRRAYDGPGGRVEVTYLPGRDGITLTDTVMSAGAVPASTAVTVLAVAPGEVLLEVSGVRHRFAISRAGGTVWADSGFGSVALTPVRRLPAAAPAAEPGALIAPMPGTLVRAEAEVGGKVRAGQPVLIVEAMKMEHQILAPADGILAELRVTPGTQVAAGDVLALLTGPAPVPGTSTPAGGTSTPAGGTSTPAGGTATGTGA